jgi:hypothetical protein
MEVVVKIETSSLFAYGPTSCSEVLLRHLFLISGHTFLPNDRDFAQIEKRKRTKINEVHVPSDWFDVGQTSRTSNPFHVIAMFHQDIYDLNVFSTDHYARPPAASTFIITDIEFCISQDDPFTVNCKYAYTSLEAPAIFNIKENRKSQSQGFWGTKEEVYGRAADQSQETKGSELSDGQYQV